MLTFQVEILIDCLPEIELLLQAHFEEVATNKDGLGGPNMDKQAYFAAEQRGELHIVTARSDGKVAGYYVAFVRPHLHYVHSLSAITDIYYLMPELRQGRNGIRLFTEAERTLKQRGVQRVFSGTKKHNDMSKIFEYLGWQETERLYVKWIG